MSDAADTPTIGLPPRPDDEVRQPTPGDLLRARCLNLLGLVSPAANVAMVFWSPRELRWFGVGAGVICAAGIGFTQPGGWIWWTALVLHYGLVVLGLVHPLWPEFPARAWIAFGKLLGVVMTVPIFGLLYYLAVTPTAVMVRLFGTDPLRRKAPPDESYWQPHEPPSRERYERQF